MTQVVSFQDFTPAARYDSIAWSSVQIEEGTSFTGPWTVIDTLTITPLDSDPTKPASRNLTTSEASDTTGLWYRLTFIDANGDKGLPTVPVQNAESARQIYASVEELAQLLRVRATERRAALERVLESAATEIDSEIGTVDINGASLPYANAPALVREVNLERAVEHWQQMQSPFGVLGLGDMGGATYTARDSWDRHAHKLAPLKASWGIA